MGQHCVRPPRGRTVAVTAVCAALLTAGGVAAAADPGPGDAGGAATASGAAGKATVTAGATITPATTTSRSATQPVRVTLTEKNNSGVSGTARYGDRVVATARGMDPAARYYSFVYGRGSSASGNNPCILTGEGVLPSEVQVGRWTVSSDGTGALNADAPLEPTEAGTMSIRRDPTGTAGTVPLNPATFPLVACGQVGPRQSTPLGQVQDQLPPVKVPATSPR